MVYPPPTLLRLTLALPTLLLAACLEPRPLDWTASFALPVLESRAIAVEAIILEGGCDTTDELWHAEYSDNGDVPADFPPTLEPQHYGFVFRARDVACDVYAEGCTEVELPRDGAAPIEVVLSSRPPRPGCPAGCREGICVATPGLTCALGTLDCNGLTSDGCESRLDLAGSCGGCGIVCAGTETCLRRPDGTHACAPSCDAAAGLRECTRTCTDVMSDRFHCGACDMPCPERPGARGYCIAGTCTFECLAGRADCNATPADGCEIEGPCP
jgi:hypothetical protein